MFIIFDEDMNPVARCESEEFIYKYADQEIAGGYTLDIVSSMVLCITAKDVMESSLTVINTDEVPAVLKLLED